MASRMASLEIAGMLYAVLNGRLRSRMALQPIINLDSKVVIGHEALFRIERHPELDPTDLWSEATRTGVLESLEDLVAQLCADLPRTDGLLFVNADPRSAGVVDRWRHHERVVVELSEAARIPDSLVHGLEEAGISYAVDDVGSGQANLGALVRMHPAYIKVDRSIVDGCHRDPQKAAMLGVLAQYASDIGAHLIAEGVEVAGEAATLRRIGVPFGQGYLFGKPVIGKGRRRA